MTNPITRTKNINSIIMRLKLKSAITDLSDNLFGKSQKPYKIKLRKILPFEKDLVTVGIIDNKIKFEVRENEGNHNEAHFHITIRGEGSGSYRISDFSAIKTSIPRRTEKKLLAWARDNRQLLIDTWNEFHGYRITVR